MGGTPNFHPFFIFRFSSIMVALKKLGGVLCGLTATRFALAKGVTSRVFHRSFRLNPLFVPL